MEIFNSENKSFSLVLSVIMKSPEYPKKCRERKIILWSIFIVHVAVLIMWKELWFAKIILLSISLITTTLFTIIFSNGWKNKYCNLLQSIDNEKLEIEDDVVRYMFKRENASVHSSWTIVEFKLSDIRKLVYNTEWEYLDIEVNRSVYYSSPSSMGSRTIEPCCDNTNGLVRIYLTFTKSDEVLYKIKSLAPVDIEYVTEPSYGDIKITKLLKMNLDKIKEL